MALLYPEESYKINGAIYEVHKALGHKLSTTLPLQDSNLACL